MLKKLHKFILKSYAGPLAMTFFISVFILVMQGLWRYSSYLMGKGLGIDIMAEVLFYLSLQTVPMALPLAILLASLMTFGNLGENFELTAIKASGVSLFRIMKPLITLTFCISVAAFWYSNNVMPVANLKLFTLMQGVKTASPELEIKENIYYDGVDGFRIKVNKKDSKSGMLYGILIHDHRDKLNDNINVTMADSGKMSIDSRNGLVVLTLYDGVTYDEKVSLNKSRLSERARQLYRHDEFSEQVVQIGIEAKEFSRDESSYKGGDRMKNIGQLTSSLDSLIHLRDSLASEVTSQVKSNHMRDTRNSYESDSLFALSIDTSSVVSVDSLLLTLTDAQIRSTIVSALRSARSNKQYVDERLFDYQRQQVTINKHGVELHRKFTMPVACLLFFFIGAPLGAIIRKGGLGMPVVVSVFFFIFYYVIDTFGVKMAKEGAWPVVAGMWLSTLVLAVIGVFLTYKSATDSALFKSEAYAKFADKIKKRLMKKKVPDSSCDESSAN